MNKIIKKISLSVLLLALLIINLNSVKAYDSTKIKVDDDSIFFPFMIEEGKIEQISVSENDENSKVYMQKVIITKEEYDLYENTLKNAKKEIEEKEKIAEEKKKAYIDIKDNEEYTVEQIDEKYNEYNTYYNNVYLKTYNDQILKINNTVKMFDENKWVELVKSTKAESTDFRTYYDFTASSGYSLLWVKALKNNENIYNFAMYANSENTITNDKIENSKVVEKEQINVITKEENNSEVTQIEEFENPQTGINDYFICTILLLLISLELYVIVRKVRRIY